MSFMSFWARAGMSPRRPLILRGPYRLAALAAAFALTAGVPGMSRLASQPASNGSGPGAVWAETVSGHKVLVTKPASVSTPIHPEKITHPGADSMGAVTGAHAPAQGPAIAAPPMATAAAVIRLPGIDVSAYQGYVSWWWVARYIDFSYAKATEGTYYKNPYFYNQYERPYQHGIIRGAYHFAIPSNSSGRAQADYFIKHGGGWSSDGLTLPGALDIEYNPYGRECYRFTHAQMVRWIWNFVHEYAYREHAFPVIYTTYRWWSTCTGNYAGFRSYDPLWIAHYASGPGTLPGKWGFYTFWQYTSSGRLPGDQDVFNGSYTRLRTLAVRG